MTDYRTDAAGRPLADGDRPVLRNDPTASTGASGGGIAVLLAMLLAVAGAVYFLAGDQPASVEPTPPPAIGNTGNTAPPAP